MRFLSLSRPWPWVIFDESVPAEYQKTIENRCWMPPISQIGQRIALHAAKSWDDRAITMWIQLGLTGFPNRKDLYPSGVIVGVATIVRVVTEARTLTPEQRRWFFEPTPEDPNFGWVLADRIALRVPIPCRGVQGLRELPPDVNGAVMAQLAGR